MKYKIIRRVMRIYLWLLTVVQEYRQKSPKSFIVLQSLSIGVITGLIAVLLKTIVHLTGSLLYKNASPTHPQFLYLALPGIGILLTVLYLRHFIKDSISHGISKVLQAISKNKSRIPFHNTYSSVVSSTLTVGFGGSVGLEAPIVYTGSAVGASLARFFRQDYKTSTLLLACGAAGAIAGIFKAPIAATIFALEVLMIDLSMWSIIPLLIASVSGAMVSFFLMGNEVMFSFTLHDSFEKRNIAYYLVLGICCGLIAVGFMRQLAFFEAQMKRIKRFWLKVAIGAVALGLLIFCMPPLFGEGYLSLQFLQGNHPEQISQLIQFDLFKTDMNTILLFLCLVLLFKGVAVAATTASGGIGGVFAPALFMGGITGFVVANLLNKLSFVSVSVRNFSLVGMAGIMAGIMHAPLTAMFLVAEITGGYGLIAPLIVTSITAYLTVRYFEKTSVYTRDLFDKGEVLTHNKDQNVLRLLSIDTLIDDSYPTLKPTDSLRKIIELYKANDVTLFPVLGKNHELLGVLQVNDVRKLLFDAELLDTHTVAYHYHHCQTMIERSDSMERVMSCFDESQLWFLPVVDCGVYCGIISKSKLYADYRTLMVQLSDD